LTVDGSSGTVTLGGSASQKVPQPSTREVGRGPAQSVRRAGRPDPRT
jgi:hypothetical protein